MGLIALPSIFMIISLTAKPVSMPDMSKDFGKLIALGLKGYKDIIVDGSADPKLRDNKGQGATVIIRSASAITAI
jgi:uncharacterized membrane protein